MSRASSHEMISVREGASGGHALCRDSRGSIAWPMSKQLEAPSCARAWCS